MSGSCFRTLVVILVSDFFKFRNYKKEKEREREREREREILLITISISLYIMCVILCLFGALGHRVGALQMSIII